MFSLFHTIVLHQLFPKGREFSSGDWAILSVNITHFGNTDIGSIGFNLCLGVVGSSIVYELSLTRDMI